MMRIGFGFDTHAFVADKPLVLGGVNIPFEKGLLAHSDGDAVIHAICDAILGALALGDIGQHFPDTRDEHAGKDSRLFLRAVAEMMVKEGYQVNNIDVTIIAEAPKLAVHSDAMRTHLAEDLAITVSQINIKATRNEKMGHLGQGEGVAVHAVALLQMLSIA
ncbi:MAG: 2-C-methyl-D-erythritol 2,4-cyclodiphosphate synthase [Coxiellaceae bacterium]|nr:2-C-methyl-D-erythritol 2,4-cyclodiphosphate synthase [Coxiellaceae bacterium]